MKATSQSKQSLLKVESESSLMEFLENRFKDLSRTTIKSLLRNQQVVVGTQVVRQFDFSLKVGDQVTVKWGRGVVTLKDPQLRIVFEDDSLIVVEKDAGLLSIATQKEKIRTAYSILSDYVKKTNPKNRIFVVHRLDRETSGLMLFAKNPAVQSAMQNNWKYAVHQRSYTAVAEGIIQTGDKTGKGIIRSYLWESKSLIVYSSPNPEDGQLAVTHYQVLETGNNYSLVKCHLETGKKNQIRVHLNSIGHPLAGDIKYGGHPTVIKRMALHADKLSFMHPVTGELLDFDAPMPASFKKILRSKA